MAEKVKMEAKTCSKVTKNPFFNFLRCYRAQAMNQHRTAVETAVQGAKIWKKLSAKQREPFEKMAEPLLKPGVKRRPRASATRRRRASRSRTRAARASRSRSRTRRATAGRKRSATRRRRSTTRRRSAAPKGRKPAARSTRRSRSRSAARKRTSASRRRAGSSARGRKSTTAKRASRKRSRSRARSAPAKRARRATKARSASRKRGRPAGARARRAEPVKLEAFTSPAGCDVCPKPAVADGAHSAAPTATSGAVLVSASIDEACNASVGSGTLHQGSYDECGSPPAFQISAAQQLICGPELSQSSRSRRTGERKAGRNRSVLSEDEVVAADSQKSAKRARV